MSDSLLVQNLRREYAESTIAILGFGREGQSSYRLLKSIWPEKEVAVFEQQPKIENFFVGEMAELPTFLTDFNQLSQYQVIFKTPAIALSESYVQAAVQHGSHVTSQLNEFLKVYRQQAIGVTGTKGKSTTSALIAHCLKVVGQPTLLAGNIGLPLFEIASKIVSETTVVAEMSSYQLDSVQFSPHVAVMVNLFPEHLNYHGSLENYGKAKANITRFQTANDLFFFHPEFTEIQNLTTDSVAQKIPFLKNLPTEIAAVVESLPLATIIKKENIPAAVTVLQKLGIDDQKIIRALKTFEGLPHRLQKVVTVNDVQFIDDTLATIPEATVAALSAFPRVDVVILGGFDRGIEYQKVVDAVIENKVKSVAFFPPSGLKMLEDLEKRYSAEKRPITRVVETMAEAVEFAFEHAEAGGTVLLSPASPSFGRFANYEQKSAEFVREVHRLAEVSSESQPKASST